MTSPKNDIIPMPSQAPALQSNNPGRLVKKTFFDLTDSEARRLDILALAYANSSFNNSKNPRSKEDYLLIMLKGMELGFAPMAAVDCVSVINGKPAVDGKGMLALIYASGEVENIRIVGDDNHCTVTMKRRSYQSEFTYTFTMNDASKMGLTRNKDGQEKGTQYQKQPKVMLKWRAVAGCAREAFPDYLMGLYSLEELAPDETTVYEDGTMEFASPVPSLPAQAHSAHDRDEWLDNLYKACDSFYSHENHKKNSIALALEEGRISREMTVSTAAATMLKHCVTKPVSDGGLELTEDEIDEVLGGKEFRQFLADHDGRWAAVWLAFKTYDLRKAQESANQEQVPDPDDFPM